MYVYEMPYGVRQRLIDVLNVNDAWRELAGVHMGYNQVNVVFVIDCSKSTVSNYVLKMYTLISSLKFINC